MVSLILVSLILASMTLFSLIFISYLMVFVNNILTDILGPCNILPPFITGFLFLFLMFFIIGWVHGLG